MPLFINQPAHCAVCGVGGTFPVGRNRPVVCSDACMTEYDWRCTLYILGKQYYPDPELTR